MPIQVSTVTVIDDSLKLQNITGANGKYNSLFPQASVITNALNFDTPMMTLTMTGNVTFSETNKGTGKAAMLLLDTSSDKHTPNFSGNIQWSTGAAPTWSDYQHWQIAFQCFNSTQVRAVAVGFTSTIPPEVISLSGSAGTPADRLFPGPTYLGVGSGGGKLFRLENLFRFTSAGDIQKYDLENGATTYSTTQWCNVTPSKTYYIRVTENPTGAASQEPMNSGTLNTWLSLATNRSFGREESYDTFAIALYGDRSCSMKVEISDQSDGSNILATGYYTMYWNGGG